MLFLALDSKVVRSKRLGQVPGQLGMPIPHIEHQETDEDRQALSQSQ